MQRKKMFILAGPSGSGKTTIEEKLFADKSLNLEFSISATTRKPRIGEIDGKNYYFIKESEFDLKVNNNEFLEWNKHFDHKYGTLKSEIERILSKNKIPFLELDVNGVKNLLNKKMDFDIITIFIQTSDKKELEKRIRNRNSEKESEINTRLNRIDHELEHKSLFDYVIINDEIDKTIEEIKNIIKK